MATRQSELLRLFVAVELPERVLEALAALQSGLRQRGVDGLRWVRPEGIHLTLKFLGETPSEKLTAVQAALAEAVTGVPKHRLSLGGLGTFGGRRPQVLWVEMSGEIEMLAQLQQQAERALKKLGFPAERRPFAPHLTLARVRPESAPDIAPVLAKAVAEVRPPPLELEVKELSLMRSILGPGGAVYERLAAFALTGGVRI